MFVSLPFLLVLLCVESCVKESFFSAHAYAHLPRLAHWSLQFFSCAKTVKWPFLIRHAADCTQITFLHAKFCFLRWTRELHIIQMNFSSASSDSMSDGNQTKKCAFICTPHYELVEKELCIYYNYNAVIISPISFCFFCLFSVFIHVCWYLFIYISCVWNLFYALPHLIPFAVDFFN